MSKSKTISNLSKIKDQEYERQQKEKEARFARLKESRRKYSRSKLKSKTRGDSRASSKNATISKSEYDDRGEIIDIEGQKSNVKHNFVSSSSQKNLERYL